MKTSTYGKIAQYAKVLDICMPIQMNPFLFK